jgi:hypothetical protein
MVQTHNGQEQDRGKGAKKIELERRLDANEKTRRDEQASSSSKKDGSQADSEADAGNSSPSELGAPEYYAKDSKPDVVDVGVKPLDDDE